MGNSHLEITDKAFIEPKLDNRLKSESYKILYDRQIHILSVK